MTLTPELEARLERARDRILTLASYAEAAPKMLVCESDGLTYDDVLAQVQVIQSLIASSKEKSDEMTTLASRMREAEEKLSAHRTSAGKLYAFVASGKLRMPLKQYDALLALVKNL